MDALSLASIKSVSRELFGERGQNIVRLLRIAATASIKRAKGTRECHRVAVICGSRIPSARSVPTPVRLSIQRSGANFSESNTLMA